jgi:hypothetical protein
MAVREGRWQCTYCSVVNRGRDLKCTGCGATRDKDTNFFLEEDAAEVTDRALLATAQSGADWLCQFCQTSNRPTETACRNCGAERGTSPSRPVQALLSQPPPAAAPPKGGGGGCLKWVVVAVLLLLAGFCYYTCRTTEGQVTVTGFEWHRTVQVEAYRTVQDTAWEGELPQGARVLSSAREVHHSDQVQTGTRRVKVGTKDLGNGFFEDVYEDQPAYQQRSVYRTRFTFAIERWVKAREADARGQDQSPRWPDPALQQREREAGRSESYVVLLRGKRDYRMELPEARWTALRPGERHQAVIQGGSRVIELK